jgi:type I restriction enzyme S subunit
MSSELRSIWKSAGGKIPDEWAVVTLESLLLDNKSISVGVMYPGEHTPGGVPLIKVGDIKDGSIPVRPEYCISPETNHEYRRSQLSGEELLITLVGNPGECVVVTPEMTGWNPARAIASVRLKDSELRTYIKAVLESSVGKHLVDVVLNTTVQKTLNLKDIRRLPIPMPDKGVIKGISSISEALTNRISLLRETNKTLQAIAQAIFKSWFIDFDPVRAKIEGRAPTGMDEETAELFPDEFVESELGLIPKGWNIGVIGDVMYLLKGSVNPSKYPSQEFHHFSLPAFDNGQMPARELGSEIKSNKTAINERCVLLSKLNPHIPRVWLPSNVPQQSICSTEFLPLISKKTTSASFVYSFLSSSRFIKSLSQYVTGTSNSHQRLKPDVLLSTKFILPITSLIIAFENVTDVLFEKVKTNRQQAFLLEQIRETLLPRLISGKLRISEDGAKTRTQ